jgi:hypothetical protein
MSSGYDVFRPLKSREVLDHRADMAGVAEDVGLGSNSEIAPLERHVRSYSDRGHRQVALARLLRANSGNKLIEAIVTN